MNIVDKAENEMELRDWFAGQALGGIISDPEMTRASVLSGQAKSLNAVQSLARASYDMADAMMEARK